MTTIQTTLFGIGCENACMSISIQNTVNSVPMRRNTAMSPRPYWRTDLTCEPSSAQSTFFPLSIQLLVAPDWIGITITDGSGIFSGGEVTVPDDDITITLPDEAVEVVIPESGFCSPETAILTSVGIGFSVLVGWVGSVAFTVEGSEGALVMTSPVDWSVVTTAVWVLASTLTSVTVAKTFWNMSERKSQRKRTIRFIG